MLTTSAHQSPQQEAGPFRSSRCPESKPATQRTLDPMAWPEKPCRPKQLSQQAVRQYASSRYGRTESCRHRPPGRPVARQVHPSTGHDADEKLGLRAHPRPFATCHTCSCCLRSKVAKAYDHKHRHASSSSWSAAVLQRKAVAADRPCAFIYSPSHLVRTTLVQFQPVDSFVRCSDRLCNIACAI